MAGGDILTDGEPLRCVYSGLCQSCGWMRGTNKMTESQSLSDEALHSLDDEAALIDAEGPWDPYDTTYTVPHQRDIGRVVEFDLRTVTIDDIIVQCGYPESARRELVEIHRRIASNMLHYHKGSIKRTIPLLEATLQTGVA